MSAGSAIGKIAGRRCLRGIMRVTNNNGLRWHGAPRLVGGRQILFQGNEPSDSLPMNRYAGFAEVSLFGCSRPTRYIPGWQ